MSFAVKYPSAFPNYQSILYPYQKVYPREINWNDFTESFESRKISQETSISCFFVEL